MIDSAMVNWLVIGIGDITRRRVIPAVLSEPRSRFHSVLTRHPKKAKDYPGVRVYTALEAALDDPEVSAVYVASPVVLHAAQTIAALRAGKHVLCEKPMAMNYREARTMVESAGACGRLLGVAYYRRLYPKLLQAKQLIDDGAIGKPTFTFATYHGWLESAERAWLKDPAVARGGPLFDVASHRIDACNMLFGSPERATGLVSNAFHDLKVEDSATTLVGYAGGVHAVVDVRWNSLVGRDEFRVIGTEGELDLTPLNGASLRVLHKGSEEEKILPAHNNVHYPAVENFVAAVLDGKTLACSGEQGLQTAWVTERIVSILQ